MTGMGMTAASMSMSMPQMAFGLAIAAT